MAAHAEAIDAVSSGLLMPHRGEARLILLSSGLLMPHRGEARLILLPRWLDPPPLPPGVQPCGAGVFTTAAVAVVVVVVVVRAGYFTHQVIHNAIGRRLQRSRHLGVETRLVDRLM